MLQSNHPLGPPLDSFTVGLGILGCERRDRTVSLPFNREAIPPDDDAFL